MSDRPLGERWEPHGHDSQPVVEILTEPASPHRVEEILAGCRDDRDVGRLALRRAEPANRAVFEDLQELRLDALRQQAHLVQEERAAVRRLEQARLGLAGIGEGPRSKPNSSASRSVSGIAAQFSSTSGPVARGPARWRARASSPFPVPVSPRIRMVGSRRPSAPRASSRPTVSRTAWIAGLSPSSSARGGMAGGYSTRAWPAWALAGEADGPSQSGGSRARRARLQAIEEVNQPRPAGP